MVNNVLYSGKRKREYQRPSTEPSDSITTVLRKQVINLRTLIDHGRGHPAARSQRQAHVGREVDFAVTLHLQLHADKHRNKQKTKKHRRCERDVSDGETQSQS